MRALTLTQPWATLHVATAFNGVRPKEIESRSWRVLDFNPNEDVAIHAGKGIARELREMVSDGKYFREPFRYALRACGYSTLDPWRPDYLENFIGPHSVRARSSDMGVSAYSKAEELHLNPLPLAAVVGTVRYFDVRRGYEIIKLVEADQVKELELALGFYDESQGQRRYGFRSHLPQHFSEPVPCRGHQQFWRLPEDIERQVRARMTP